MPLTCDYCRKAPATQLLVVDWGFDQGRNLVCTDCPAPRPEDVQRLKIRYARYDLRLIDVAGPSDLEGKRS